MEVRTRLRTAQKIQDDLQDLRRNAAEASRRAEDRQTSLEQEFSETDTELKKLLEGFDEEMTSRKRELDKCKQQHHALQATVSCSRDKVNTYNKRLGEGFAIQQEYSVSVEKESKMLQDVARLYNLTLSVSTSGGREGRVVECLREMDRVAEASQQDGQRSVSSAQCLLDSATEEYRAASAQLQRLQLEIANDDKELSLQQKRKVQIRTELANCDSSTSQRTARPEAEADVAEAKAQWEEFNSSYGMKTRQLQEERRGVDQQIVDLMATMAADSRLHQDMSLHRAENERLDAQRRLCEVDLSGCVASSLSASEKYRDLIARHIAANGSTLDATSVCSFSSYRDVETVARFLTAEAIPRLTRMISSSTDELQAVQRDLARLQAEKEADGRRRGAMEASLDELRQAELTLEANIQNLAVLRRECDLEEVAVGVEDSDGLLSAIKEVEESAVEEEMALRSSKSWRDVIFRKSREHVPASPAARGAAAYVRRCPCCERGMTADDTVVFERAVEKLLKSHKATVEIISGVKARVDRARALAKHAAECFMKITGFGPQRAELKEIESRVAEATSRMSSLQDRERQVKADIDSATRDKSELAMCVMHLDRLHSDWIGVTQRLADVQQKLTSVSHGINGDPSDHRSISDIEDLQRRREVERDDLQRRKERLMEDDNRLTKRMHALKATLADRERVLMEVVQRVAHVTELESKLQEIDAAERSLTTNRETRNREMTQVRRAVADKEATEKAAREELRRVEEKHRQTQLRIDTAKRELSKVSADCTSVQRRLEAMDIPSVQQSLDTVERELKTRLAEIEEMVPRMRTLEDQLQQQERTKKLVLDNIAYRACRQEAEALQVKLESAQARLAPSAERDYRNAERDLQKGMADMQRLENERHTLEVSETFPYAGPSGRQCCSRMWL